MMNKFQKGLTLIELMAVVTMITIVTGIVFANYGIGRDSLALERASQKLYQDFRLVINMAMAGSTTDAGYGIYFNISTEEDRKKYIIYKDIEDGSGEGNRIYNPPSETLYEINLEAGVEIGEISRSSLVLGYNGEGTGNLAAIFFKSPYPTTFLNPDSSLPIRGAFRQSNQTISIKLRMTKDHNKTRTITVNSSGMINVSVN